MLAFLALIFLLGLGFCFLGGILSFMIWSARNYRDARKYRSGMAAAVTNVAVPVGPSWTIVYHIGSNGKKRTVVIPAESESKALDEFIKTCGVGFAAVVSCEETK